MKVSFRKSLVRDLNKIKNADLLAEVAELIERLESSGTIAEIVGIKKLSGSNRHYRIRIGDYRLGLIIENNEVTLVRFLHRKEIYRHFP